MTVPKREAPYTIARRTCAELMTAQKAEEWNLPVRIDTQAANAFRQEIQKDEKSIQLFGASLAQDANFTCIAAEFPSVDCEEAWIVLTHAVDFGSGFRQALHKHHGKGAWITVKAGVEALFAKAKEDRATNISANWLQAFTKDKVANLFGIQGNGELDLLASFLVEVLHDLGKGCEPYEALQELVSFTLNEQYAKNTKTPAADFVWMLVDRFPKTFDDRYLIYDKQEVCFYKKAQLVTGELYHRFRGDEVEEDNRFSFADGDNLTAYIDNVIVACMRYKGIVIPDTELQQMIETHREIPMGSIEEVTLRAAAMCGVEVVVQGTSLTSSELGNYLWAGLGKRPEVRTYTRHATKTIYY